MMYEEVLLGAEEKPQSIKRLAHKHENLISIAQTHVKDKHGGASL